MVMFTTGLLCFQGFMALAGGGRCQEGDLAHEAGEGSYVTMWIFAHGRRGMPPGRETACIPSLHGWVETFTGGMILEALAGGGRVFSGFMTAGLYVETGRDPSHAMGRGNMPQSVFLRRRRVETLRRNDFGGVGEQWVCFSGFMTAGWHVETGRDPSHAMGG